MVEERAGVLGTTARAAPSALAGRGCGRGDGVFVGPRRGGSRSASRVPRRIADKHEKVWAFGRGRGLRRAFVAIGGGSVRRRGAAVRVRAYW